MAQIIRITSEALQATVRRLLPSQQGFGEDLQASNIIQPIIDLTPTAEGSILPGYLQTALAMDSQTAFSMAESTTSSLVSTPGFFRIIGYGNTGIHTGGNTRTAQFQITDGLSNQVIYAFRNQSGVNDEVVNWVYDFNVFLKPGETLQGVTGVGCNLSGSTRQIADSTGNLVNPAGFTSE